MKKPSSMLVFILLSYLMTSYVNAQPIKKGSKSIHIGPALSQVMGGGGSSPGVGLNAEVGYAFARWIGARVYIGGMYTGNVGDEERYSNGRYGTDARFFYYGAKLRLALPLPSIAPFFSLGIGNSYGTLRMQIPFEGINQSGLTRHVVGSYGLAVGDKIRYELLIKNFIHFPAERFDHGFMLGISVPIE